jgi:hypothetical protein
MTLGVAVEIAKEEYGATRQQMRTALRVLLAATLTTTPGAELTAYTRGYEDGQNGAWNGDRYGLP